MTTPSHSLTLLDNMRTVARSAGTSMLMRRVRSTTAAFFGEVWELMNAAGRMRVDLRRMADECEHTDPEQAARLRKLANSNWGE